MFDADSNLVSQQTQQLSAAALNNYESLRLQVVVPQDGYVSAYVGNESNVDVFFDDVTVEHRQGLQVQENHYDPYGLDLAGVSRATPGLKPLNQYQFNGKERQVDLGVGWSDYGARFYDNQAPHWTSIDPVAEKMSRWSPYTFSFDNPLRFLDTDGMAPGPAITGIGIGSALSTAMSWMSAQLQAHTGIGRAYQKLNDSEKALATEHPLDAAFIHGNQTYVESFQDQMAGSGIEQDPSNPSKPRLDGGITNAFKHGLFSALNAQDVGQQRAKEFGDAHEQNPDTAAKGGNTQMDLRNNAVGREVAKQYPAAQPSALVGQLLTKAVTGKLTVLNGANKPVTLQLTGGQVKLIQGVINQMQYQEQARAREEAAKLEHVR
ncbi:RHS repeat domain-containing protein [Hymenobacter montanus]|uniref:RHS repeat domain-containing protein n=1 Tax=Hymenobacter montanus TaxID=2771359 RepID=UPI00293BF140|nr:RHS repeat-associated core domain-containing protein [Hymenobacter montanus]